jgi:hypothetical protein
MALLRVAGVVALGLIIVLSIIPGNVQMRTSAPKGLEHFVAYFVVASALALGYRHRLFAPAVGVFLIVVAAVLEQVQRLVPGRTATLADWEASSLGALLGAAFAIVLGHFLVARRNRTYAAPRGSFRRKSTQRRSLTEVP